MKQIQKVALWAVAAIWIPVAAGQFTALNGQAASPAQQSSVAATPSPAPPPLRTAAAPANVDRTLTSTALRSELSASELRLHQAIRDSKPGWLEKLWPAILGLFGVLVGGGINIWLQSEQRAAAENANRASAAFDAQKQIIEYRSRQTHEFYYPLLLSLQRSAGVRRQLCDQLQAKNSSRFQFHQEDNGEDHYLSTTLRRPNQSAFA